MKYHSLKRRLLLSFKSRLLLGAGVCSVVLILLTGVTVQHYLQDYLRLQVQSQLTLSLDELLSRLDMVAPSASVTTNTTHPTMSGPILAPISALSDPRFKQPYSGFYWQVQSQQRIVARSRSLWDSELDFHHLEHRAGITQLTLDGPGGVPLQALQQRVKLPDGEAFLWVTVTQESASLQLALTNVSRSLVIGLGLLALGLTLLLLLQLSWGLRPLTILRRELKEIEAGSKQHFQHDYPREIDPLVKDINRLLNHHQQSLERARTNAGNMAHALKTPLTIMQNELVANDPPQHALLVQQLQQMRQQIEYHLSASQIAAKQLLGVKCSPYQQCAGAVAAFSRLYSERNIVASIAIDESLLVAVDSRDFDEMAGNLIDNAYKWAVKQVAISAVVVPSVQGDMLHLCVADDGPGMTAAECQLAITRGKRLDEQTPGSGLGLSIVAEMVRMYQGELQLQTAVNGGLVVILTLPVRDA